MSGIRLIRFAQGYVNGPEGDWIPNPRFRPFGDLIEKTGRKNLSSVAEELIKSTIRTNRFAWNGTYHQYGEFGAPVFADEDGNEYLWDVSMRRWGEVMADAWNLISEDEQFDYVDFYIGIDARDKMWHVPKSETDFIV